MRTRSDYRENVRHGRNVWLIGEGPMEDVTTHPAASAMVGEHFEWYDCHFDFEWGGCPSNLAGCQRPPAPPRPSSNPSQNF